MVFESTLYLILWIANPSRIKILAGFFWKIIIKIKFVGPFSLGSEECEKILKYCKLYSINILGKVHAIFCRFVHGQKIYICTKDPSNSPNHTKNYFSRMKINKIKFFPRKRFESGARATIFCCGIMFLTCKIIELNYIVKERTTVKLLSLFFPSFSL